jgi:hypothetical protein
MNSNKIISNKPINEILKLLYQPGKGINSGTLINSFLNVKTGEEYKTDGKKFAKTNRKFKQVPTETNVYTFDFKTKHCTWWKEQEK